VVRALGLLSVFREAEESRAYGMREGSSRRRMVCRDAVEVVSIRQSSMAFSGGSNEGQDVVGQDEEVREISSCQGATKLGTNVSLIVKKKIGVY
jgi:hypothetical protein